MNSNSNRISLFLIIAIFAVKCTTSCAFQKNKHTRKLSKSKKKSKKSNDKKLYADIEPFDDVDYDDLNGWVSVKYDDDDEELKIDYHIKDGPEECDTCKLVIYDGDSCNDIEDYDYDRRSKKDDKDPFYDEDEVDENPWNEEDTIYVTNEKGRAAGYFSVDNGYDLKENECKFVVLFDEYDDRRRRRRRNLASSSSSRGRKNGSIRRSLKKGKKGKNPKKIGCGQLIPDGEDDDYCD